MSFAGPELIASRHRACYQVANEDKAVINRSLMVTAVALFCCTSPAYARLEPHPYNPLQYSSPILDSAAFRRLRDSTDRSIALKTASAVTGVTYCGLPATTEGIGGVWMNWLEGGALMDMQSDLQTATIFAIGYLVAVGGTDKENVCHFVSESWR